MVHPNSELNITGEQIIRKCLTIKGNIEKKIIEKKKRKLSFFSFFLSRYS